MKVSKVLLAAVCLFPSLALAASSGTLTLSGTVSTLNDILITPNGSNNLNLNITGGESGKNVAAVQESSNDPLGYKINLKSTNAGQLQLSTDATKFTAYQVSYDGGSFVTPTASDQAVKTVSSLTQKTVYTSQLSVNVTALPNALAGTYSDTLTVSIVAN
jgi:hypothetical protein